MAWTYPWLTGVWLAAIALSGVALSLTLFGPEATPRLGGGITGDRDDAVAVVEAFGSADEDSVVGIDPPKSPSATRIMTYRKRRLRAMLVRRARGSPPRLLWKLVGFTEPDGRSVVSGEEALRRLIRDR